MLHRRTTILIFFIFLLLAVAWISQGRVVNAAPVQQDATPTPAPESAPAETGPGPLSISDEVCLSCHGQPGLTMPLADGSTLDLYVPAEDHQNSVHGQMGYACVQCHREVGNYPHPPFSAQDARDASLQLYTACKYCHAHQYDLAQDSVHSAALVSGNNQAAICTDCHTAHQVRRLTDPETHELTQEARAWIPQTCARCHSAIYEKYQESVHGSALEGEGNPDVPTCIDCHGVHNIEDPTTTSFRVESPAICAKCHTDPKIMNKYGISTDVMDTYVADFHGTTAVLFNDTSEDATFNKPVCYDCHGVHDIVAADDPQKGLQVQENLLETCQECHPDATENFPAAWLSHYIPSREHYPFIYFVNLFYIILIPVVIGGMALLVSMDFGRRSLNRYRARRSQRALAQATSPAASEEPSTSQLEITLPEPPPAPDPDEDSKNPASDSSN